MALSSLQILFRSEVKAEENKFCRNLILITIHFDVWLNAQANKEIQQLEDRLKITRRLMDIRKKSIKFYLLYVKKSDWLMMDLEQLSSPRWSYVNLRMISCRSRENHFKWWSSRQSYLRMVSSMFNERSGYYVEQQVGL